jgi:hypothetical protein
MMSEVPPHGFDELPGDGQRKLAVLTYASRLRSTWLPDCLWPSRITDRERYLTDIVLRVIGKDGPI